MRHLSEQERSAMIEAYIEAEPPNAKRGFEAGFAAGLDYRQDEIDNLRLSYDLAIEQLDAARKERQQMIKEQVELDKLLNAIHALIDYRDRVGPLNFQLEKADDFISALRIIVAKSRK